MLELPEDLTKISSPLIAFCGDPSLSVFIADRYFRDGTTHYNIELYINQDEKIGMPDIIDRMREDELKVGIYPISENAWLDMGQFDSMESMERRLKELKIY